MELLRVVDSNGNDTDEVLERNEVHDYGKLHNEVTIYIINNNRKVLLQKRSKNRRFCPNKLGVIAGHVMYNENALMCAIREAKEEVGLDLNRDTIHFLDSKYLVKEVNNNHFMYPFYVIVNKKEEDFVIQREELDYVKWYKIDDVIDMINNDDKSLVFKKDEIRLFEKLKEIIK